MGSAATRKLEGFMSLGGEAPWLDPNHIKIVGLDIEETAENWFAYCPRAKEPLEPEWVNDIRQNGVREPVDVYRDGDTTVMLEGRRRVRAARIVWDEQKTAGVPLDKRIQVRVVVRKGDPAYLFGFNVGSENRKQRSPMQRAMLVLHAKKFVDDDAALAKMFACTAQTIKNQLALFDLAADVQRAVDAGTIPSREAVKLGKLPREEQKKALAELVAAGATKGAAAANGIEKVKRGEKVENADRKKMRPRAFIEKLRDELRKQVYGRDFAGLLDFILGGDLPAWGKNDADFQEALEAAGFKAEKKPKAAKKKAA